VIAYAHARARRFARHREWMIRSFALAAFFVSFSLWDPMTATLPVPPATGFALAVLLAWTLNLAAAELWVRVTRRRHPLWRAGEPIASAAATGRT
jgi:hypothetical protein